MHAHLTYLMRPCLDICTESSDNSSDLLVSDLFHEIEHFLNNYHNDVIITRNDIIT